MAIPAVLFVVFALLSAGGAFWIADRFGSRRLAIALSLAVAAFFVALHLVIRWLLAAYGG